MSKQQFSRNPRGKRLRPKHAFQIFLLVAVSIWLMYQLKHSYNKRRAMAERSEEDGMDDELIRRRLSRKDFLDFAGHAFEDDILGKGDENDAGSGDEERKPESKRGGGDEQEDDESDDEDEDGAEDETTDEEQNKGGEENGEESPATTHRDDRELQSEHDNGKDEEKSDNQTEKERTIGSDDDSIAVPQVNSTERVDDGIAVPQVNISTDSVNGSIATAASLNISLNDFGSNKNGSGDGLYHDGEGTSSGNESLRSNTTIAVADEKHISNQNYTAVSVREHNSTVATESEVELEPPEKSKNTTAGQDSVSLKNGKEDAIWGNLTLSANETVTDVPTATARRAHYRFSP